MGEATIDHLKNLETNLDFWDDGKILPLDKPTVHADEHSINYSSTGIEGGCTTRRRDKKTVIIFRPIDRFNRFVHETTQELHFKIEYTPKYLTKVAKQLIRINEAKINTGQIIRAIFRGEILEFKEPPDRWYVRPVVRNRIRSLGVYDPISIPGVYMFAKPFDKYLGEEAFKNGAVLKITKQRRAHPDSTNHAAKSSFHYHVGANARKEAMDVGATEGILRDVYGYIADGSGSSPAMIKGKVLYIPRYHSRLRGIVLESVIELAKNETDLRVKEADISPMKFKTADEVLIAGNAVEVMFARKVDDQLIGDGTIGPYTKQLQNMYFGILQNDPNLFPKCDKYQRWCESVCT